MCSAQVQLFGRHLVCGHLAPGNGPRPRPLCQVPSHEGAAHDAAEPTPHPGRQGQETLLQGAYVRCLFVWVHIDTNRNVSWVLLSDLCDII